MTARAPAAGDQRGLDEPEPTPGTDQHRPVNDAPLARARGALDDARLGGFAPEGERRQGLGAEVYGQDLHDGQGQRYRPAGESVDQERGKPLRPQGVGNNRWPNLPRVLRSVLSSPFLRYRLRRRG